MPDRIGEPGPAGSELSSIASEAVDVIAAFHGEHQSKASPLQVAIDRATAVIARPGALVVLVAAFGVWLIAAYVAAAGRVDGAGFAWLELGATLLSLFVVLMVLVTQKREDRLAERRAQLTLELALLGDRKIAKAIALLEELRRDTPGLADRHDAESADMAKPTDPKAVLSAIEART